MKQTIIFDFYKTLFNPQTGQLYWGIKLLLKNLSTSNRLILITTNGPEREAQINKTQIKKYFDSVIICQKKTLRLYKKYAIDQPIIIGDRQDEELSIGKKLGYKTIQIVPNSTSPYYFLKVTLNNFL